MDETEILRRQNYGKNEKESLRPTAVRQVSCCASLEVGEWGCWAGGGGSGGEGERRLWGKMEWILICLLQQGSPLVDHTEGWNAWRIAPMVWPRQNTHCGGRSWMV